MTRLTSDRGTSGFAVSASTSPTTAGIAGRSPMRDMILLSVPFPSDILPPSVRLSRQQHRTRRVVDHVLCRAPQQQFPDLRVTIRTHYQQVGLAIPCKVNNRIARIPV